MWKSSIQQTFIPAPIKPALDTAPPTNTFIPRPITRPNTSQRPEQVDEHVPPLPARSRPLERGVDTNPYIPRSLTAPRPIHRPITQRAKPLQGLVIYIEWGKGETKEAFFTFLGRIRELGGTTTNSLTDPSITHFLLGCSTDAKQQVFTYRHLSEKCRFKYQQVVRNHSKWLLPESKALDVRRNKGEKRTRVVVWREWLWDVLDEKLGLEEEGKWGIYLRSELDVNTGLILPSNERNAGIRVAKDPRIKSSILSIDIRNGPQDNSHLTPPPSADPLHAEVETASIEGPTSPIYRERSSPEEDLAPSSSYIATPPSATISLPKLATGPSHPPRNRLEYTFSPTRNPNIIFTSGLFTPPPSASPPPGMRSPDYIMIPKSHFANVDYVWQPPSGEAASPKYEDLPSPLNEEIASPSYSPISTPSDPGSPPPLQLEVTVEPFAEKNEGPTMPVNTPAAVASIRPLASRHVSFGGTKRPRPRSPIGGLSSDRPLAKRQSLPCMQSRSRSRSDSPLTPSPDEPDEDMMDEAKEDEEGMRLEKGFQDGNEDGSGRKYKEMAVDEDEQELEVDEERFPSPGSSPSPSLSHHSDSDSESGCGPIEFDDEPNVFPTGKVPHLISKSVDKIDIKTIDLTQLALDCDLTDELAGLLECWI